MTPRLAVLALCLSSCAHAPPAGVQCVSTCGVLLYDSTDCDGFQASEDRALAAFEQHVRPQKGWTRDEACTALEGYVVRIREPGVKGKGTWYSEPHGYEISGECSCQNRRIVLGTDDWRENSHAHELAHAIEGCFDFYHETWEARGIYGAINVAKAGAPQ